MRIESVAVTARVYPNGPTATRLRYDETAQANGPVLSLDSFGIESHAV